MSMLMANSKAGAGGTGGAQTTVTTIATTATAVVDSVPTNLSKTVKWIVVVELISTGDTQAYEILALQKGGTTSTHSQYAIIGDTLNHDINVIIVGSDLTLQVTNNEVTDIAVDVARIEILS